MQVIQVETATEMLDEVLRGLPADIFVSVAAVADWRPETRASGKLKLKTPGRTGLTLRLTENPDILHHVSHLPEGRPQLVIGFAAETQNVEEYAAAKLARKGCNWIIANDVSGDVMGGADNEIVLLGNGPVERWRRMTKEDVARKLADRISEAMAAPHGQGPVARAGAKTKRASR